MNKKFNQMVTDSDIHNLLEFVNKDKEMAYLYLNKFSKEKMADLFSSNFFKNHNEEGHKLINLLIEKNMFANNAYTSSNTNVLLTACRTQPEYVILGLIDAGANINTKCMSGSYYSFNALMMVACHQPKLILEFIKRGADPLYQNAKGLNTFLVACSENSKNNEEVLPALHYLIENNLGIAEKTDDEETALILATGAKKSPKIMKMLLNLNKGIDLHAETRNGVNALMMACFFYPEYIIPLIEKGANLYNKRGEYVLDYIQDGDNLNKRKSFGILNAYIEKKKMIEEIEDKFWSREPSNIKRTKQNL